jgi:hypothetical protein
VISLYRGEKGMRLNGNFISLEFAEKIYDGR